MRELALISHLISIEGIGSKTLFSLFEKFGSAEKIVEADFMDLVSSQGVNKKLAQKIIDSRNKIENSIEKFTEDFEKLEKSGGKIISFWDDEYPEILKRIYLPPIFLYTKGNKKLLNFGGIAIVGTRKPTHYGIKQAEYFAEKLSENKLTIVSGLARGIDTHAHKAALNVSGNTIAVLGNGLDFIYPPENKRLYEEISEKGLLVTEYPLGTLPDAINFPRRNRIISGLTLGTLVIESKITGGALHTAAYALEQGREVFALPGNIGSLQSEGTNRLIQRGEAKLVLNEDDILIELKITPRKVKQSKKQNRIENLSLDIFEQKIYETLNETPQHLEKIAENTNLSISEVSVYLLNLELKGLIEQLPGKYFVKT